MVHAECIYISIKVTWETTEKNDFYRIYSDTCTVYVLYTFISSCFPRLVDTLEEFVDIIELSSYDVYENEQMDPPLIQNGIY
jgi:hypothetical protein